MWSHLCVQQVYSVAEHLPYVQSTYRPNCHHLLAKEGLKSKNIYEWILTIPPVFVIILQSTLNSFSAANAFIQPYSHQIFIQFVSSTVISIQPIIKIMIIIQKLRQIFIFQPF